MAVHPRLKPFFNGAHKTLEAAFERSIGSSSTCTGTVREVGIRDALRYTVPNLARIHHGELIDAHHRMSGQLDGIIVHAGYPALGGSDSDAEPRIVLAEGAVAVIESKSDMEKNWDQVKETWKRVVPLRRSYDPLRLPRGEKAPNPAIPFIVVGYKGWDTRETLARKAEELWKMFLDVSTDADYAPAFPPPIYIFQVSTPGFGAVVYRRDAHGNAVSCARLCKPWRVMAQLSSVVTFRVQDYPVAPHDFARYIKPDDNDDDDRDDPLT